MLHPVLASEPTTALAHDVLDLTAAEADEVASLATGLAESFAGGSEPLPAGLVAATASRLPPRLGAFLSRGRAARDRHAILIRGTHLDDSLLDPTPLHWRDGETSGSAVYSCVLLLHAAILGEVVGWQAQQDGRLVTDVMPSPGFEDSLVSSSSRAELGWHTEDAFSANRADHVGLHCLRAAAGGATTLSWVGRHQLPESTITVLSQRRFRIRADDAHELTSVPPIDPPVALVERLSDPLGIRVDRDFTVSAPDDPEAAAALRDLVAALDENLYELPLTPGDIAFVDNRNVVHGRRGFEPGFDGSDRWLKRVNVVSDLRRVSGALPDPGSRVLTG